MRILNVVQVQRGAAAQMMPVIASLQEQLRSGDIAFMLTTEPEEPPYLDKLAERLGSLGAVREAFAGSGQRVGVLAQTTLGHAERYQPRSPAPFQRMVDTTGEVCQAVFCPLDPGFGEHLAAAMAAIAAERPAFILLDDDFRLSHPQTPLGCFCPMHLDLLAERHGTRMSREGLLAAVAGGDAAGEQVRRQWHDVETDSILGLARRIRTAIDEVDPAIPAGICATPSGRLINNELARTVAGRNRPLVRLAGSVYMEGDAKSYSQVADRMARQRTYLSDDVEVLVEADTFPHQHYSTSGKKLIAHLVTALLLGLDGAKAWVAPQWGWHGGENPQFVAAYTRIAPLADTLGRLGKQVRWCGATVPIRDDEPHRLPWSPAGGKQFLSSEWTTVFGRMALPQTPGGSERAVRAFSGAAVTGYTRAQWADFLAEGVLLDGHAAVALTEMGFADAMGVRASLDPDLRLSGERYAPVPDRNGASAGVIRPAARLRADGIARLAPASAVPTSAVPPAKALDVLGEYISVPWRQSDDVTVVAPSVTAFHNESGGRVAVYAAALPAVRPIQHFIDPYRRPQLSRLLSWLCPREYPLTVDCDTDLYLLIGELPDGTLLVYALNLQADAIENLDIGSSRGPIRAVDRLGADGTWAPARTDTVTDAVTDTAQVAVDLGFLDFTVLRVTIENL